MKSASILGCMVAAIIVATLSGPGGNTASAAEWNDAVHFRSATYPPTSFQMRRARQSNKTIAPVLGLRLEGRLKKPNGAGPFPAVVLLHGCNGISSWNDIWSARLTAHGYVVLEVDSFGPRNQVSVCARPWIVSSKARALDAHGAKTFLSALSYVDPSRIAVMGMSHGGWSTLKAIDDAAIGKLKVRPFDAAVAFYPWCEYQEEINAPLLILIGSLDDWTPAKRCREFRARTRSDHEFTLKVYQGAHHVFDLNGLDARSHGHILRHHPEAAKEAIQRAIQFLGRHL